MGVSLFVFFEPKIDGADTFTTTTDGKCLAAAVPLLDEICAEKGLAPFTRFLPDFDEIAELALDSSEEELAVEMDFDPDDGLKTIAKLIKALQSEEKWARGQTKREIERSKREIEGVVQSLELLQADLKVAKRKNARFCLSFS